MEIYFVFFFILAIASFFKLINLTFLKIIFVILILFTGLRYNVGNDYLTYQYNFNAIKTGLGESVSTEPLYLLINYISPNFEFVIFFYAFFSFYFLYKALIFFSDQYRILNLLIFYSLYFIIFDIHIIRQGLSVSIVLYSYIYLYKKEYKTFLFWLLIAFLSHKSALFVLVLLPFFKINFIKFYSIYLIFASIIFSFFSNHVLSFIYLVMSYIPFISNYSLYYRIEEATNYGISFGIICDLILFILLFFNRKKLNSKDFFLYKIFFVSIFFTFIFLVQPNALRLIYYFRVVNIFLFVILFCKIYLNIFFTQISIILYCYLYFMVNFTGEDREHGKSDRNLYYKTILKK